MGDEDRSPIDIVLEWIGFTDPEREELVVDFASLKQFRNLKEEDITTLASEYSRRTVANGRIYFGLQRKTKLKSTIHWIQDFKRCGEVPTIEDLAEEEFQARLIIAAERAVIRKQQADSSESVSREASPGKLKDEKKWIDWAEKLETMLSAMPGANGVPLSYVIRDNEEADRNEDDMNFVQKTIACAPLDGPVFEADARKVHQLILGFVQGENADQWLKPHLKQENGRTDMIALRKHFEGEGNVSRRITEAEHLRNTLHYKGERALPFSHFITKCQNMFNIFSDEGEAYSESQKLRFLLDKVNCEALKAAVAGIRLKNDVDAHEMTFVSAANHLASEVSRMPESIARAGRNISGVAGKGFNQEQGGDGIYRDGAIHTGYYKNWFDLSKDDQEKVRAERQRLGIKPGAKGGAKGRGFGKKFKKTKAKLAAAKRTIASLKQQDEKSGVSFDEGGNAGSKAASKNDAGNGFGGRSEKKSRRDS